MTLFVSLSLGVVFIISGLILNLLQVLVFLLVRPLSKSLHQSLNYYLLYSNWSQLLTVSQWWSKSRVRLYTDEETLKYFCKEHQISIMNHRYEVDWLMCWLIMDHYHNLANSKSFIKNELKKVPVIGWGWACSDMVFVRRNWDEDSKRLSAQLDTLMAYHNPINLLMFSEGTRFTPEKHKASMEFAQKRGLPELKYHLIPRTRGFIFCARNLQGKLNAFYDLQLCFSEQGPPPTFVSILLGRSLVADFYVRRIPLYKIPTSTDEEAANWLIDLFQHKDQLMEVYKMTGRFPGQCIELKRRWAPLLNTLGWTFALVTFGTALIKWLADSGHYIWIAFVFVFLAFCYGASYSLVRVTKTKHGSSYGKAEGKSNGIKNKDS